MCCICLAFLAGRASERKSAKVFSASRCEPEDFRAKLGTKSLQMRASWPCRQLNKYDVF